MLINFWSQVTLVGEIMEHREICVRWKWRGRNSCVVLSSVVSVTFYELWTPMITWVIRSNDNVYKLSKPTGFLLSGSGLRWKWNHPSKQKGFFHLSIKKQFGKLQQPVAAAILFKVCYSHKGPNMSWDRGGGGGGVLHQYLGIGERHWGFETLTLFRIKKSPKLHPLFSKTNLSLLPCLGQKT